MDLCQAEEYIKCGLADSVLYKDEMIAYLKQLTGRKEDQSLNSLFLEDMINVKKNVPKDKSGNVVAVYYASGEILDAASSNSTEEVIDGQKMTRDLRRLRDDNNVKAVVLRVNSPGGSAYASEQIWREVVRLKEKKPVIVSMGDYAASGGIHSPEGIVKAILAGASAVEICSAFYQNSYALVGEYIHFLNLWMDRKGMENIPQFKGMLNVSDLNGVNTFERTQFMKYFSSKK